MIPYRFLFSFIATMLAVSAIVGACGEGQELSLEAYVQEFLAVVDEVEAKEDELEAEFGEQPDPSSENPELLTGMAEIAREAAHDLDELKPPDIVAEAHHKLVRAAGEAAEALENGRDSESAREDTRQAWCEILTTAAAEGIDTGIEIEEFCS